MSFLFIDKKSFPKKTPVTPLIDNRFLINSLLVSSFLVISKEPLLDTEDIMWEKKYPTFIINRCLSMFYDTIMHSNEMNGLHFLPKRMQFHYFINSIRKKKRFGGKWLSQKKVKDLEVIKEYYGYSNQKAKEALNLLSDDQIEFIKIGLKKGGRKK